MKRLVVLIIAVAVSGLAFSQTQTPSAPTTQPFPAIDNPLLPNAHRVTSKLISGGEPEGEEAFRALRDLGVKTIISVDGATPDVQTARKYGIQYVHIPITYSTVTHDQGMKIAKALDEMPGVIYLHCHHGQHRSAAAVATACVMNGMLKPEQAESVLQVFGTGVNYTGLWKSARDARPVDIQTLHTMQVVYTEKTPIPPLADAMVHVDDYSEHLKTIQSAGWKTPADHPDLDPAHEALMLEEHLREIGRTDVVQAKPANFRTLLSQSESNVKGLRDILSLKPIDTAAATTAMTKLTQSCTACHKEFRD